MYQKSVATVQYDLLNQMMKCDLYVVNWVKRTCGSLVTAENIFTNEFYFYVAAQKKIES